jgi:putative transposase
LDADPPPQGVTIARRNTEWDFSTIAIWLPRRDEMQIDLTLLSPREHGARPELRSVVGRDEGWPSTALDQFSQLSRRAGRRSNVSPTVRSDSWVASSLLSPLGRWLWRAVDQDGYVLDEIVQTRRDAKAAARLLRRLLKKHGVAPKRIVTDKLASYAAARREIMPTVEHRSHKSLNNRAENSHLPVRRRECAMQGFRSPGGMRRLVATFSAVRNHFVPPRSRRSALSAHIHRIRALAEWKAVAGVAA